MASDAPDTTHLAGRIVIRRRQHAVGSRYFIAQRAHVLVAQSNDGGHAARMLYPSSLHQLTAAAHQAQCIGEGQRACGDQRGVFAQAVPRRRPRR